MSKRLPVDFKQHHLSKHVRGTLHTALQKLLMSHASHWILEELKNAPMCICDFINSKKFKYKKGDHTFKLPTTPGVYVMYFKKTGKVFYVGQAGNLKRRVGFHFAESTTAQKTSPLKKKLKREGYTAATHSILQFKWVEVFFGRIEIEDILTKNFKLLKKSAG